MLSRPKDRCTALCPRATVSRAPGSHLTVSAPGAGPWDQSRCPSVLLLFVSTARCSQPPEERSG